MSRSWSHRGLEIGTCDGCTVCLRSLGGVYSTRAPHIQVNTGQKEMPFKEERLASKKASCQQPCLPDLYLFFSPWSLEWGKEGLKASGVGWPRTLGTAVKCFIVIQSRSCVWLCDHMNCGTPGFPVLSLPPGVCSNSCLMCWWCHLTILTSVAPFSALNLSQHQGLFQWISSSHQVSSVLELQLQHQSFHWIFWVDFL